MRAVTRATHLWMSWHSSFVAPVDVLALLVLLNRLHGLLDLEIDFNDLPYTAKCDIGHLYLAQLSEIIFKIIQIKTHQIKSA